MLVVKGLGLGVRGLGIRVMVRVSVWVRVCV